METIEAVSGKKMRTIETEMIKALVMFSYGRVSYEKAAVIAAKTAPIFYEASRKNKTLAHKGLNWYAKELLKVI
ncbi:MAG: hypothetical protein IJQ08_01725 [Synergistaceae bacterium]|nr:hypothetical protein [Synergistaceae bacterium]